MASPTHPVPSKPSHKSSPQPTAKELHSITADAGEFRYNTFPTNHQPSIGVKPMNPSRSQPRYNWKRFWCERGGTFSLSDDGYLTNPDAEYRSLQNPDLVSTEALQQTACAVLLGEPGIGKSHCIREMWKTETVPDNQRPTLWFDLRAYGSEERLIRDIFESSAVQSWTAGTGFLHIFLDSLDEGLLRIGTLAAILSGELTKLPVERLKLRIACRTADWPITLETQLKAAWGEDVVKVYELTPLRKLDVRES